MFVSKRDEEIDKYPTAEKNTDTTLCLIGRQREKYGIGIKNER